MKLAVVCIFAVTYALLIIFSKKRAYISVAAGIVMLAIGAADYKEFFSYVDLNVLMLLAGMMIMVKLFTDSQMPVRLGDYIINGARDVRVAIVLLALLAGIISAFVDNVATVLMLAPIAIKMSEKLKISPVPAVVAIAVSSNLQGAATLVGDTTSILLGTYLKMSFSDFFVYQGKPGLFFVIEAGAVVSGIVLLIIFRKFRQKPEKTELTPVRDYVPGILLVLAVASLAAVSFVDEKPAVTQGLICLGFALIGTVYEAIKQKKISVFVDSVKSVDTDTLLLLAGVFVCVGALQNVGIIDDIGSFFATTLGGNPFAAYTAIVFGSVILSAFIDNIPYVAAMLPVMGSLSLASGININLLCFGLLAGATLGGNLTPIGASANIAALGILKKSGYSTPNGQFMKISVPFTLSAVLTGYVLVWLIWA